MADSKNVHMTDATRVFSTFTEPQESQSTVIIGAGIMGCATAYFLSQSPNTKPDTIHIVESSPELFASASGKAAGFVASDWFGPPTASLGALSFRLHKELADKHDGLKNWGYSRSTASSLAEGMQRVKPSDEDWMSTGGSRAEVAAKHAVFNSEDGGPGWLRRERSNRSNMLSEEGGVAQVDPLRLSQFLLKESLSRGVRLHHPAKAVRISKDLNNEMSAIRIEHDSGAEHKIPCTRLLITAGAWTSSVFETLFPGSHSQIGVSQLAGHSLVVRSPRWTRELESKGCHAVFTTMRSGFSPEIFSRIGEEIYIAGLNDPDLPLPDLPTDAKPDKASVEELNAIAQKLLGTNAADASATDLQVVREALCFRPVTSRGVPILARIPDDELGGIATRQGADGGVFICAGHGPWGISHSIGTGKVMAEMLEGSKLSADVRGLGLQ